MTKKKCKDIVVASMTKTYAETVLEKKLTKKQLKNLPDFVDYLDDQFWDDVNEGMIAALKDWFEDTAEE